jgi:hypothetical protein
MAGVVAAAVGLAIGTAAAGRAPEPEVLHAVSGLPPHLVGQLVEPYGFGQSASGQYFVFDRRGHAVFGIDAGRTTAWRIVHIGHEAGRIIQPFGFAVAPDGRFLVADAPAGRERVQIFAPEGYREAGFTLPDRSVPRVQLDGIVVSGVGSLHFTGQSVLISRPESGSLVTEYSLSGEVIRSVGTLRPTGQEGDRNLHLALNSGFPVVDAGGQIYFVFQAGEPRFRKYDARGTLLFERVVQGRELDPVLQSQPTAWPRPNQRDIPMVRPIVRTAALDRDGRFWIALSVPFTYVYDSDGEKIRTVQFRGAGVIQPTSLALSPRGRLLATPGCHEFDTN